MRAIHVLVAGLAAFALAAPPAFAAAGETILKNQKEQVEALAKGPLKALPKGKTLETYPAPDKATALLVRDEGEQGDFVWRTLYVRRGGTYQAIGTCNEVGQVAWGRDSKAVGFMMRKATDYNQVTTYRARHVVGSRKVVLKPTSVMTVEPAG